MSNSNIGEKWFPVPDFNGYEISQFGRVRSHIARRPEKGPKLLKTECETVEYPRVRFRKNGKYFSRLLHVVILEVFVGPRPPNKCGLHRDDNPMNYSLVNLYWGTRRQNMQDRRRNGNGGFKLTVEDIHEIKRLLENGGPQWKIARLFSISDATVSEIKTGSTWGGMGKPVTSSTCL